MGKISSFDWAFKPRRKPNTVERTEATASSSGSSQSDGTPSAQKHGSPAHEPAQEIDTPVYHSGHQKLLLMLWWIARYGWLTTRQLARACWRQSREPMQAARKAVRRMKADGLSLTRALPNGYPATVLSNKGVQYLAAAGFSGAKCGKDMLRHTELTKAPIHRHDSNEYLLHLEIDLGLRVYTEYQIRAMRSPLSESYRRVGQKPGASWLGKIPDGLAVQREWEDKMALEWIEVEASKRCKRDADKLARFIIQALRHPYIDGSRLRLFQITLVFPYDANDLTTIADAQQRLKWILRRVEAAFAESVESDPPSINVDEFKETLYRMVSLVMMDVSAKLVTRHIARFATLASFARRKGKYALYLELAETLHPKNAHEGWVTWLVEKDKRIIPKDPRL